MIGARRGGAARPRPAPLPGDEGETLPAWRADRAGRAAAQARLDALTAELLAHPSATLTLDRWCAVHRIGASAEVVADRVRGAHKPPTSAQRQLLAVSPEEPVRYRRVNLRCGAHILSRADNWYVPARLTPAMNAALAGTDIAFGRAVQSLGFARLTLSAIALWTPLPAPGAPVPDDGPLQPPPDLIEHRAVLTLQDGTPFAAVVETYTRALLGFPETPGDGDL